MYVFNVDRRQKESLGLENKKLAAQNTFIFIIWLERVKAFQVEK